jgi:ribosomal-protein-alanine N-acetyltransferase
MRRETPTTIDTLGSDPSSLQSATFIITDAADAEAPLFTLVRQCEDHPWSEKNIASALADPCAFHFLLCRKADGALCSYVLARLIADELEIDKVGTHPDFRRRGCATTLLKYLLEQAKERGCRRAFLEVRAGNRAAQACYGALGFTVASVRKRYYESQEDAIIMSRGL